MSNADNTHAWIPLGRTIGRQLFQMDTSTLPRCFVHQEPCLLSELPSGSSAKAFVRLDEAPWQSPLASVWILPPTHCQRAELMSAHGEDDQVDSDGKGRVGRRVVGHALIIVVFLTINTILRRRLRSSV